jgi:hypothetical protein
MRSTAQHATLHRPPTDVPGPGLEAVDGLDHGGPPPPALEQWVTGRRGQILRQRAHSGQPLQRVLPEAAVLEEGQQLRADVVKALLQGQRGARCVVWGWQRSRRCRLGVPPAAQHHAAAWALMAQHISITTQLSR